MWLVNVLCLPGDLLALEGGDMLPVLIDGKFMRLVLSLGLPFTAGGVLYNSAKGVVGKVGLWGVVLREAIGTRAGGGEEGVYLIDFIS